MTLKNKVALVTGSTSGIGLGIARRLAAAGANIMFNGFGDVAEITALRTQIANEYGIKTAYNPADLSKGDQATALVQDTIAQLGGIDILVNNAGIQHVAPVENFPPEKWEQIIAINLSSAFYTIAASVPQMQKTGFGRIINIASAHGLVASKNKSAYVASKHGILGLTKVVALENADQSTGKNITCNAICPGWVLTPLVQKQIDDNAARAGISAKEAETQLLAEKEPALRFATPEEIGDAVVFLCSDSARMITGISLPVDGGWTAQ